MTNDTHNPYADEARERWGDTPRYQQSMARTARYTEQDWREIKATGGEVTQRLAAAMRAGVPAGDAAAMALAEEHRSQIDRWFYDCDHAMHRCLGDMYVADARFAGFYDAVAPGLAGYLRDAIHANADAAR